VAPALFATRSPLPAALAVTVPVLAAASYDQSRLDWLRTLKDFGVAKPIGANLFRVAVELATLVLCFALHAADHAVRLRASALETKPSSFPRSTVSTAGWSSSSGYAWSTLVSGSAIGKGAPMRFPTGVFASASASVASLNAWMTVRSERLPTGTPFARTGSCE